MSLSTFGAIMGFAAEMAGQAHEAYREMAGKAKDPDLKKTLQELAAEEQKNQKLMERTRREHVTEMILEPVSGLYRKDYEVEAGVPGEKSDAELLAAVLMLEAREKRFFEHAGAKVPLPEVARIFKKIGKKKEESIAGLQKLRAARR